MISRSARIGMRIDEAVVSPFGERMSEQDLTLLLSDVRQVLSRWLRKGTHNVRILIRTLNTLQSSKNLEVYFSPRLLGKNTINLWIGASCLVHSGEIIVSVNLRMNPKRTAYSGTPPRRTYTIDDHIYDLREHIIHELIHYQQHLRDTRIERDDNDEESPLIYHMPPPGFNDDDTFLDIRRAVRRPDLSARPPGNRDVSQGKTARSLYTGDMRDSPTSGSSWYHGQPEEIMAYAVETGELITRKLSGSGGSRRGFSHIFHVVPETVQVYTNYSQLRFGGKTTPAYKLFLKYLAEYLIKHKGIDPQEVSYVINSYFG